ncbi:unnamed protein product [Nezara viridula]|uniref:Uncharacterized protein n=1 Tax=Nezara viridula TaxID=85310 RepID=A0A9P0MMG5_NEZVI|nr:unnamed protein product [Nezara viridula]
MDETGNLLETTFSTVVLFLHLKKKIHFTSMKHTWFREIIVKILIPYTFVTRQLFYSSLKNIVVTF